MKILITGGTGLIGRHLIPHLRRAGHNVTVVTRDPRQARQTLGDNVTLWQGLAQQDNLNRTDAVINLAGEPVVAKRWTRAQKQRLCDSRWQITQQLVAMIRASETPPAVFISGSATGYYGNTGDMTVTEKEEITCHEFTHTLCARWEQIACGAQSDRTRVCLLRTGAVLARTGGIVAKMTPVFKMGLGGPAGSGRQYLPWIHIDDMVKGILWLLDNNLHGPFNLVSPRPVTNAQFAHTLSRALKRPALIRVPAMALRLLMGESSTLILGGQRALPERLNASGFTFRWDKLSQALRDLTRC